ncbi:MAG TPA: BamA/TamA family outer membrane protein, partial [Longimicrobiales bacterium]
PQSNFLPPEERFYAGGSNTVRGFDRNQLGPGVWFADSVKVDVLTKDTIPASSPIFVPTGGTIMGIVNVELRTPSPILSQQLSLAWFVDAASVGTGQLSGLGAWRATPGIGLRAGTPVGPFRLDVAYNPYPANEGPLYHATAAGLVRLQRSYRPPAPSFLGRLHFTLAVGQAF